MGRNISQQGTLFVYMLRFGFSVCVFISMFSFLFFFFFSFMHFRETKFTVYNCSSTVYALFTESIATLFRIKILKIGLTVLLTHLKIILLQYFQFSVFSFQFSVSTKISSIQTAPIYNQCPTHRLMLGSKDVGFMYLES